MSFIKQLKSYGIVSIDNTCDMIGTAEHLIDLSMSFKAMFDFDGSATFYLIEPEDQK